MSLITGNEKAMTRACRQMFCLSRYFQSYLKFIIHNMNHGWLMAHKSGGGLQWGMTGGRIPQWPARDWGVGGSPAARWQPHYENWYMLHFCMPLAEPILEGTWALSVLPYQLECCCWGDTTALKAACAPPHASPMHHLWYECRTEELCNLTDINDPCWMLTVKWMF